MGSGADYWPFQQKSGTTGKNAMAASRNAEIPLIPESLVQALY
jgi:hypothetical protein